MDAYTNRTNMISFKVERIRISLIYFVILGILFLLPAAAASTPPIQPSLTFDVTPVPGTPDASLVLQVTWTANDPLNTPPEYILVDTFSIAENRRLGTIPVPREGTCDSGTSCTYRKTLGAEEFPPGSVSLTATDPLSQATNHRTIAIAVARSNYNPDLFLQFEQEQRFSIISLLIGALLLCMLAILIRKPSE